MLIVPLISDHEKHRPLLRRNNFKNNPCLYKKGLRNKRQWLLSIYGVSVCDSPVGTGSGAGIAASCLAGFRPSQVGVGECGVLLSHGAETLDGIHQVLFIHILKKRANCH